MLSDNESDSPRSRILILVVAALLGTGALAGCLDNGTEPGANGEPTKEITIGVPAGWEGEALRSQMVRQVLTEELGYEVKMFDNVDPGAIYASLGSGDVDIYVGGWMPIQETYLESQPEGSIVRIGHNVAPEGIFMGVAVPKYVYDAGVTSIADLKDYPEEFDQEIIGFDPGGGMMITGQERMAANYYGLGDWTLVEGSVAAQLAAYDDAVAAGEWIAMLAWQPHFMYQKWEGENQVMNLEDPGYELDGETVYLYKDQSDAATIETLVASALPEEHPDVAAFLERFQVTADAENQLMWETEQGKSYEQAAADFLEANPDLVDEWLGR